MKNIQRRVWWSSFWTKFSSAFSASPTCIEDSCVRRPRDELSDSFSWQTDLWRDFDSKWPPWITRADRQVADGWSASTPASPPPSRSQMPYLCGDHLHGSNPNAISARTLAVSATSHHSRDFESMSSLLLFPTLPFFSTLLQCRVTQKGQRSMSFSFSVFSSNDIRSGEEKCLAAFPEAVVLAEWNAAPPEMQHGSQEAREDTRMTLLLFFWIRLYTWILYEIDTVKRRKDSRQPVSVVVCVQCYIYKFNGGALYL